MNEKFVLLVDDNEDDVVLTQMAFQKCQVPNKLEVVYDGQEALEFNLRACGADNDVFVAAADVGGNGVVDSRDHLRGDEAFPDQIV